jgi:hypothetical protein
MRRERKASDQKQAKKTRCFLGESLFQPKTRLTSYAHAIVVRPVLQPSLSRIGTHIREPASRALNVQSELTRSLAPRHRTSLVRQL